MYHQCNLADCVELVDERLLLITTKEGIEQGVEALLINAANGAFNRLQPGGSVFVEVHTGQTNQEYRVNRVHVEVTMDDCFCCLILIAYFLLLWMIKGIL